MCNLWCAVYLPTHPHHREQLQQVLREGQDRGGDPSQEEESVLGGCKARSEYFIYYFLCMIICIIIICLTYYLCL